MIGPIPFQIPTEFLAEYGAGELVRYGAILKSAEAGRIVAHLQQTGVLDQVLGVVSNFDPTGITGLIGVVQNAQMSSKLSALQTTVGALETLQLASLASSVAGIGVTAASTALILQRLRGIEGQISGLSDQIEALSGEIKLQSIHKVFSDIAGAIERIELAERRSDAAQTVQSAEDRLHYSFRELSDITGRFLLQDKIDATLVRSLLAGLSVCSAAQVKSLYWLNELKAAEKQAQEHYRRIEELSYKVTLDKMKPRLAHVDNSDTVALGLLRDVSEVRARLAAVPSLSGHLRGKECHGRAYLAQLEEQREAPLLVLAA